MRRGFRGLQFSGTSFPTVLAVALSASTTTTTGDYDDHAHTNAETITTLELTFESEADSSERVVQWTDGEGAQSIVLDVGTNMLSIRP